MSPFSEFMRDRVGPNWVIARRTPRIVRQYGEDVICLTPKRYEELEIDYEKRTGLSAMDPTKPSRFVTAAAGDMLAALKDARLMLHAWRGSRLSKNLPAHEELEESIRLCETALAKARGETQ